MKVNANSDQLQASRRDHKMKEKQESEGGFYGRRFRTEYLNGFYSMFCEVGISVSLVRVLTW